MYNNHGKQYASFVLMKNFKPEKGKIKSDAAKISFKNKIEKQNNLAMPPDNKYIPFNNQYAVVLISMKRLFYQRKRSDYE